MSEVEKLRALLAEARGLIDRNRLVLGEYETPREVAAIRKAIDAALAEPVSECARCETLRELADTAAAEQGLAQRRMMEAQAQRDEARAEVARLQKIVDDTALGINAMIQSALNHPANCPIYDNGRCTCGKEKP